MQERKCTARGCNRKAEWRIEFGNVVYEFCEQHWQVHRRALLYRAMYSGIRYREERLYGQTTDDDIDARIIR